jgi:hypothetical protein
MPLFEFRVLCATDHVCDDVINEMKNESFPRVQKNRRTGSDHYGLKEFKDLESAITAAEELKMKTHGKILGVRVVPADG